MYLTQLFILNQLRQPQAYVLLLAADLRLQKLAVLGLKFLGTTYLQWGWRYFRGLSVWLHIPALKHLDCCSSSFKSPLFCSKGSLFSQNLSFLQVCCHSEYALYSRSTPIKRYEPKPSFLSFHLGLWISTPISKVSRFPIWKDGPYYSWW